MIVHNTQQVVMNLTEHIALGGESYPCARCGTVIHWEGADERRGVLWSCEECGTPFCTACFVEVHGRGEYMRMVYRHQPMRCPSCYEAHTKRRKHNALCMD